MNSKNKNYHTAGSSRYRQETAWPSSLWYPVAKRVLRRERSFGEEIAVLGLIAHENGESVKVGDNLESSNAIEKSDKLSRLFVILVETIAVIGTMVVAFCAGIFVGVLLYHPTVQLEFFIGSSVSYSNLTITYRSDGLQLDGQIMFGMTAINPSSFPSQLDFGNNMSAFLVPYTSSSIDDWLVAGSVNLYIENNQSVVLTSGMSWSYQFCANFNLTMHQQPTTRTLLTTNNNHTTNNNKPNLLLSSAQETCVAQNNSSILAFSSEINQVPTDTLNYFINQCSQGWLLLGVSFQSITSWCFGGFSEYPDVTSDPFAAHCLLKI